ncbi:MAG: TIGR03084 family metal-binding protein [Acidimicrobiia bacterium]|nr:MAG: TIGR03084 family metal-binding protein [Acidimicrobiia bacterium]
MNVICADLRSEQDTLDTIVSTLDADTWNTPTPAEGWSVRDQIGHLTFFDERATMAVVDPDAFARDLATAGQDIDGYLVAHLEGVRSSSPSEALTAWRAARAALLEALTPLDPAARVAWYGPDMSARSFATARLMETWAHGQDIVDVVDAHRDPTDRLRHVALLGVKTFGWSFTINGLDVPSEDVRVDLAGPSGDGWVWNTDARDNVVSGDVEDFCLVVTQRRHIADTGLEVTGPIAQRWMTIAQAFAGPPGPGRSQGMFT